MLKKYLQPSQSDLAVIRKLNMKASYVWIATWLGSGFLRPAPGTWGSLAAIPFGITLCMTPNILSLIIAIILVTWVGTKATQAFQNATHTHDSKMIVIDEVAGQWIAMLPIAWFWADLTAHHGIFIIVSFALFRLFDITKPWPACYFDKKVESAFSVMADDLIAGFYAAIVLTGIITYAEFG